MIRDSKPLPYGAVPVAGIATIRPATPNDRGASGQILKAELIRGWAREDIGTPQILEKLT